MAEIRAVLKTHYGAEPTGKWWVGALRPLIDQHGITAVEAELGAYCELTEATYLNPQKFAAMYGAWASTKQRRTAKRPSRPGMEWLDDLMAREAARNASAGGAAEIASA